MKGKDMSAISVVKKLPNNVIEIPQENVVTAIIKPDGKSTLKCTTLAV